MGKGNFPLYAFNRGEVSRLALGRTDIERLRLSAEEQVNWQPMTLGPMTLRPGLKYLGATEANSDKKAFFIPFVFGNDDVAALELTDTTMRIWVPSDSPATSNAYALDAPGKAATVAAAEDGDLEVLTRPSVSTTVTNGNFSSDEGWTREATDGCSSTISGHKLTLNAVARGGTASAFRKVSIPNGSRGKEHAFRIVVDCGPVTFRCGTTATNDNIIETTTLGTGEHSLAFTPTGSQDVVYVYFETNDPANRIVDSITIENSGELAGELELATPWTTDDLASVRHAQSGDVVFVACKGVHPYRIERRAARSWSLVKYLPSNGPLKATASADIKLWPGAMYGNTTLHAERPFFTSSHLGCIFRLFTTGQTKEALLGADDTYTDPIRITGVGEESRAFNWIAAGSWKGKLTLQRSMEEGDLGVGFVDVKSVRTENGRSGFDDHENLNNSIAFYRVGFKDDNYTSGAATVRFTDQEAKPLLSGGGAGFCRVTEVTNSKQVLIEILKPFASTRPTADWQEGEWSAHNGYPSAVAFHDGRLWWAGGDKIWGSVSDDFSNFDIDREGDAGPIQRSVGFGPIDTINWMLPLSRLILGREGAETSVRSSSLDEPITPTSFTLKDCSTKGSARVAAIKSDTRGLFVSKSGRKAYELALDMQAADYVAHDLTRLHPGISGSGFTRLCIQHSPDTAIHFVRADGQAAVLLYDKEDEVEAWWRVETSGVVEEAFVLPGTIEDNVYYVVKRTVDGEDLRYLEKFARRDQCTGLAEARLADSHIIDTGGDVTITGLSHLEGKTAVAWGWDDDGTSGVDLGSFTVSNGKIRLSSAYDNVCVGLPYNATFTSAKLAYAASQGSAVNQKKRVDHVGLILYDTHCQGLRYGQRADALDNLPLVSEGAEIAADTVHAEFDEPMIEVPGEWDTDSRLMLKASSPRPCTVAAVVLGIQTHG